MIKKEGIDTILFNFCFLTKECIQALKKCEKSQGGCPLGGINKVLNCKIIAYEFELQSRY